MSDRQHRESELTDRALLERINHSLHRMADILATLVWELRHEPGRHPSACTLAGTFKPGVHHMSNTVLVATIPSTKQDGSALDPTSIASITYLKTPVGGGAASTLQVNTAAAGAGLAPADLTVTDTAAVAGDSYSCFVSDTAGNAGAVSNVFTNVAPVTVSPPAAPTLSGTFTQ